MNRPFSVVSIFLVLGMVCAGAVADSSSLLPAEQAFVIGARTISERTIAVDFHIAPGYILYRDRFSFTTDDASVRLANLAVRPPAVKYDKALEKEVAYYGDRVSFQFDVTGKAVPFRLVVKAQGCAVEQGVCYPPVSKDFQVPALTPIRRKS